jgi:hypothetical protein
MTGEIEQLRTQTYSTNIQMLAQQMTSKFADNCMSESVTGKAARLTSQVSKTDMVENGSRAAAAMNVDMVHDGRWVYPTELDWGKVVDDIDLLQTNISPQGKYVQSAVAAYKRKQDDLFIKSFFGTAQTGETGATALTFATSGTGDGITTEGQVVAVTEGVGSATGMNIAKMEEAMKLLLAQDVDLDMEMPIMAISPLQHKQLKALTVVTSSDFNTRRVLGEDGFLRTFDGFQIVISNRLPTDGNSYRRCPVWVKSGMGRGVWKDLQAGVRNRPDLQRNPLYVEASAMQGYTRIEGMKCIEIKCSEA